MNCVPGKKTNSAYLYLRSGKDTTMVEAFASLPVLSEPLVLGLLGAVLTLVGSVLRSGLNTPPRRVGSCFCVFGLILMTIGFVCITSNTSLLTYTHKG